MTSAALLSAAAMTMSCLYVACSCDCPGLPYTDAPDIQVAEVAPLTPDVDDGRPDVVVPDRGSLICLGVIEVCMAECASGACFNQCLDTRAYDRDEASLARAYVYCVVDAGCLPPASPTASELRESYACEQRNCLVERTECEQRRGGGGLCAPIGGCLGDCERDDFRCYRGCMRDATVGAAVAFVQLRYCVSATCIDPDGTREDFDACLEAAIEADGVCKLPHSDCYGGALGPQSRGLQPLYGTLPRDPWP